MTDQKTVVIVAPSFPPSGLPPVHRARQFTRWLPEFGWKPVVLTVAPEFYQEKLDTELLNLLPTDLEVIRSKAFKPKKPGGWGIGDLGLRSVLHLWLALRKICRERKIDLVYLTCPPNFQLIIGRFVRAELGIPYVLDFTDPWVSDWLTANAKPFTKLWFAHLSALLLEPLAVRRAAHITSVSEGTNAGILRRYKNLRESDFTAIPIGGEPEVFQYLNTSKPTTGSNHANGSFRLVYLGAMWEAAMPVLDSFLEAVKLLKARREDLYSKLKVSFIGTSYRPDARGYYQVLSQAQEKGVEDVVDESPERLPFLEALRTLTRADGLLMLGSIEPHYTASRLLPYIHSKRPIFALFHRKSDSADLLSKSNAGMLVSYDNDIQSAPKIEQIYSSLAEFLSQNGGPGPVTWDIVDRYSAKELTKILASIFDGVAGSSRRALHS